MLQHCPASTKLAHSYFFKTLFSQACFQQSRRGVWIDMGKVIDWHKKKGLARSRASSQKEVVASASSRPGPEENLLRTIQVWPMSTTWRENGMLPLHFALQHASIFGDEVLRMLLRINPDAAHQENENGLLPLTLAVISAHVSLPIIQTLLELCPAASYHTTRAGLTPLHYISNGLDSDITALVCYTSKHMTEKVGLQPCLLSPTLQKALPLHLALRSKKSHPKSVLLMMDEEPAALEIPDADGNLPLHLMMKYGCWEVFQPALLRYPAGAMMINAANQSPLIIVLRWIFDKTMLQNRGNKASILKQLHDATDAVELLLKHCPDCARIRNDKSG